MSYEVLKSKIHEMQDEILAAIKESIAINSVRTEATEDAPYGEGPKAALMHALELSKSLGFRTGIAGNHMGWAEYGTGEEMVGILGHLDIVPAGDPASWEHDPFGGEIIDGEMWGRGTLDDKGPIIGALYAMKAIRDLDLPIDRRIRILFGTDEEHGCSCADYYVENGYELPTIGFTPDAHFPVIFCEKGTSGFKLGNRVKNKGQIEVVSFEGGTAMNCVTPFCRLVVEGDLKVDAEDPDVVTFKEGSRTIVEATGLSAHGSTPHLGKNAAVKLLSAVSGNEFGGDFQNLMDFILKEIGTETKGETLGVYVYDEETGETSNNLGIVSYDGEEMYLTLDIRYPKNAEQMQIDKTVAVKAAKYGLEILMHNNAKCLYVPKDSELVTKLVSTYENVTGEHLEPIAIGGGTYAKHFPNMVGFGPSFPGDEDVIHQPNERMNIEQFMKALEIIAIAEYELARK